MRPHRIHFNCTLFFQKRKAEGNYFGF